MPKYTLKSTGKDAYEIWIDEGRAGRFTSMTVNKAIGREWVVAKSDVPNGPMRPWHPNIFNPFSGTNAARTIRYKHPYYITLDSAIADAFGIPLRDARKLYHLHVGISVPDGYIYPAVGESAFKPDPNASIEVAVRRKPYIIYAALALAIIFGWITHPVWTTLFVAVVITCYFQSVFGK